MGRDLADYIALALVANSKEPEDIFSRRRSDFSGDYDQLKDRAETIMGFPISDGVLKNVLRTLADCGLVRVTDDAYSGMFYKVRITGLDSFFEQANAETDNAREEGVVDSILLKPSDFPNASALLKHELFEDYRELGGAWLERALEGIRRQVSELGSLDELSSKPRLTDFEAPASDRVVTFSDNEVANLDSQTSQIIDAVSAQNQIDGNPGLRELLLGQLKAGRELIRAGSCRIHLIELTLIETLKFLAKRYEREAIGGLAAALITAIAKHIGLDA